MTAGLAHREGAMTLQQEGQHQPAQEPWDPGHTDPPASIGQKRGSLSRTGGQGLCLAFPSQLPFLRQLLTLAEPRPCHVSKYLKVINQATHRAQLIPLQDPAVHVPGATFPKGLAEA